MEGLLTKFKGIIIGYIGGEPEMSFTPSGKAVTKVSIAAGQDKYTQWIRLQFWDEAAEIANNILEKGIPVYAEGRITGDPYISKKDGKPKCELKLTVDKLGVYQDDGKLVYMELKKVKKEEEKGKIPVGAGSEEK